MLKLIKSTRNTGHIGHKCSLRYREAEIGKDFGLAQLLVYNTYGFEKLFVFTVVYDDGMVLLNQLVGYGKKDKEVTLTHISSRGAMASWSMTFEIIKEEK